MSTLTTRYGLTKPADTDAMAALPAALRGALDELDAYLPISGETGGLAVAAINTTYSVRINFAKPFPVGVTPNILLTGKSLTNPHQVVASTSGEDNTGFTINYRRNSGTSNVNFAYIAQRTKV